MHVRSRTFLLAFLLVALLVAGLASYYASSHPDGLAFVAERAGFGDREQRSATADGPFAGYSTKGIGDDRVSGGVAGVVGSLVVLLLAGGLFAVLGRRRSRPVSPRADGG
jgi:cobalt/nickel transport protein